MVRLGSGFDSRHLSPEQSALSPERVMANP